MLVNRQKLYEKAEDFFQFDGDAVMKLDRDAAIEVCSVAAAQGLVVVKIEGGIWCSGNFEARLDAIWNGSHPPMNKSNAHVNNLFAINFINQRNDAYNAFIITTAPLTGFGHNEGR
jgi:Colicin-E5 Imm protein